jgi:hypothetical protein
MYLQQLYKQHKGWFIIVVLFAISQLFINFKRGVVFTPFFHYGMYAAPMHTNSKVSIIDLKVNNKLVEPFDYAAQQWDKLLVPLYLFTNEKAHNQYLFDNDIERLQKKVGINSNSRNYSNNASVNKLGFENWYSSYVSAVIHQPIQSISFKQQTYTLQNILDSFNSHH